MEKLRFSFVLPQKLAGMSWPGFVTKPQDVVDFINAQHVKIVVNLTTSPFINSAFSTNFNLVSRERPEYVSSRLRTNGPRLS